jgi:hypothetical protein
VFCFSFTLQRIRHPVERFRLPGRPPCSRDVSLLGFGFAVTLSLAAGAARRDAARPMDAAIADCRLAVYLKRSTRDALVF